MLYFIYLDIKEDKMKNIKIITMMCLIVLAFAACRKTAPAPAPEVLTAPSKPVVEMPVVEAPVLKQIEMLPAYTAAIDAANVCAVNADCVKIPAGCCQCDGFKAVNKNAVQKLTAIKNEMCEKGICTMQFCFNDVNVSCKNKRCVTEPVPFPGLPGTK